MLKRACFALCVVFALCACILSGCSDSSSSDKDEDSSWNGNSNGTNSGNGGNSSSGTDSNKIILHAYEFINVYVWNSENEELNGKHFTLASEGDGWYKIELDTKYTKLLFSNPNYDYSGELNYFLEQTEDLDRSAGEWWFLKSDTYDNNGITKWRGKWYSSKPSVDGSSSGGNEGGGTGNGNNGNEGGNGENTGDEGNLEDADNSGLYIGIITFGEGVSDLTNDELVCLNSEAKRDYVKGLLNNGYKLSGPATLMYYGVHNALVNLEKKSTQLPEDLENVYIITFTDGLDNSSTFHLDEYPLEDNNLLEDYPQEDNNNFHFFDDNAEYASWLKMQLLEKRTIKGNNIVCYSVGVRGRDAINIKEEVFKETLENVASSQEHYQVLDNLDQLQEHFEKVAEKLTVTTYKYDFTLRISTVALQKETVRMTFDLPESVKYDSNASLKASNSKVYFQGRVNRSSDRKSFIFSINSCKGIRPSVFSIAGKSVQMADEDGNPLASKLEFSFKDIGCEESSDSSYIRSWLANSLEWYSSEDGGWQPESEYLSADSMGSETNRSSCVIYLVLDNSSSLGDDLESIKAAVSNFIDVLYSKVN